MYGIFEPEAGWLEVYQLDASGRYQLAAPDATGRYWIAGIAISRMARQQSQSHRLLVALVGEAGEMLLWGTERLQQERHCGSAWR